MLWIRLASFGGGFKLHRLVVVSSAGAQLSQLISRTGDKFPSKVVYLPVWKAEQTQAWVFKSHPDAIQQWDNIEANAGLRCPGWSSFFSTTSSKPLWNNLWTGLLARTSLVRIARRKMPTPWCFWEVARSWWRIFPVLAQPRTMTRSNQSSRPSSFMAKLGLK